MSSKEENKALIEEYPFLLPRNRWTGEIVKDYDYEYTELDAAPDGWREIALQLCKELKEELVKSNYLDKYRISQIKEKYGYLRWYDFGNTKDGYKIISKYERISSKICIKCGKPAKWVTTGWIEPYCDECLTDKIKSAEHYADIDDFYKWEQECCKEFEQKVD